jgi:hypothetical protein
MFLTHVGFEVLTAVSTKMAVIALMMEAARYSETLANLYQTTQRYNPEDSHLLSHPCLSCFATRWFRQMNQD